MKCKMGLSLVILALTLLLASCAGDRKGDSFNSLERPPRLDSSEFPTPVESPVDPYASESDPEGEEYVEQKLNQDVELSVLVGSKTSIMIQEPIDQSWAMVDKALQENQFEVIDRIRDEGMFSIRFTPEAEEEEKEKGIWDNVMPFFVGNLDGEGEYHLKLLENEEDTMTTVTAEMIVEEDFEGEEDPHADPEGGVEKLMTALFEILQEN